MIADSFVKARLASYAYNEMRLSGYKAMLAVVFIIRNRVRAGWTGDWNTALNQAPRFSAFEARPEATIIELSNPEFQKLLVDIEDVYSGNKSDPMTEGGLYYYDTLRKAEERDQKQQDWFVNHIIQDPKNHPRIAQVGMVHIYR